MFVNRNQKGEITAVFSRPQRDNQEFMKNAIIDVKETKSEMIWRNSELKRAGYEISKIEDETGSFGAGNWRSYRILLRNWPESIDFPDSNKRPVTPDSV